MFSRPQVSDVVNEKTEKFTIDPLAEMLSRVGNPVRLSIGRSWHCPAPGRLLRLGSRPNVTTPGSSDNKDSSLCISRCHSNRRKKPG